MCTDFIFNIFPSTYFEHVPAYFKIEFNDRIIYTASLKK